MFFHNFEVFLHKFYKRLCTRRFCSCLAYTQRFSNNRRAAFSIRNEGFDRSVFGSSYLQLGLRF